MNVEWGFTIHQNLFTMSFNINPTPISSQPNVIRMLLRERCTTAIKLHLPRIGTRFAGTLSEASIRILMAVFELQRVELLSELEDQYIDNSAVLDVIYELSTGSYFSDLHSPSFLLDMDSHLRLLTSALRLYKFHGKSLDQQICQEIYRGIQGLLSTFENNRQWSDAKFKIEEYNVDFLFKHCFCLLQSIDNTDCLSRAVARRTESSRPQSASSPVRAGGPALATRRA